ncbi:unnamed protein product [Rotaria socialis]|uniref:SWIM-type domain-containing protein n=2 Tax=Rotaria socialis TaxID=392032 RepID=A0A818CZA0_9BILA|nr:unnamed protein product [Rotaria socialis]CAF4840167.1 unnamed protein product [Rotaria socialis]
MEAKKQIAFVEYFENEWLNSHNTWYENIQHFTPSTNDGLESFNKIIKDEDTYRERIPLSRFRIITFETVKQWSSQYKHKLKQYIQTPSITLDIWTKGYQWAKSDKSVISMNHGYTVEYYAPADDEFKISNNDIDTINTMKWNTFDQYRKRAFNVWYIKMQNDPTNWMKGICNCPAFFKCYVCKHVAGVSIRLKFCKPPPAAKDIPIGHKRKRGRPKKATKTLLID